MSVELNRHYDLQRTTSMPIEDIARSVRMHPRIPLLVPGLDAPFFQAGLAGYSDGAMRLIARRHGCPYCVTEALLDRTLISGGKGRRKEDPDLLQRELGEDRGQTSETRDQSSAIGVQSPARGPGHSALSTQHSALNLLPGEQLGDPDENRVAGLHDHPIAAQIMGTAPREMAAAAALLTHMNYDVIDVNLACPVKKMRKANRGGHCLTDPDQSIEILRAVREAVPAHIPCTVKMRRAFDDSPDMALNFERIFNGAYDLGYAWATVHCRTVQQKYLGPGTWEFLADLVARHPDKIIFGSGDVWTVEDIFAMLDITGVHAVAVARGCIGNPWIFRQARQLINGQTPTLPTIDEQRRSLLEHLELSIALHGERKASRMMRKFGIKFSAHHPRNEDVKMAFIKCASVSDWRRVTDAFYGDKAATFAADGNPRGGAQISEFAST
jgi:tRNA-dihydrouridine synthase B